jgi:hypothetical protein
MITDIYALREKCISDTIVMADFKKFGLLSCWNRGKSGSGGILETYMKPNLGLGTNYRRAGPGRMKSSSWFSLTRLFCNIHKQFN